MSLQNRLQIQKLQQQLGEFRLIGITTKYKKLCKCLDHGRATTKETAYVFADEDAVMYRIKFRFSFLYDHSNGVVPQDIQIVKIETTDDLEVTKEVKKYIQTLINYELKFY